MVQAYLRYEQAGSFGVICSNCNVVYDSTGRLLITAALESIAIWNIKKGALVQPCRQHGLVCIAWPPSPTPENLSPASAGCQTGLRCTPSDYLYETALVH